MNCGSLGDLIGPFVDDDLPEETRRVVEKHLMICRECAWETQTLRLSAERLRADAGSVIASDSFRNRTLTRLRSENTHLRENADAHPSTLQYILPLQLT